MRTLLWVGAAALACLSSSAAAQTYPKIIAPSTIVPPSGVAYSDADGSTKVASPATPLPVTAVARTEAVQLIAASSSTGTQTLFGGSYAFAQSCINYNGQSITLRYRGPDGATMQTAATKTATDVSLVAVPAGAVMDATVPSAAIGCNASMTRIPQ
ncbi:MULTISPECIES: hypothetical protein [Sphingomonas]|uniref:Uncharacterized protein n=2 Tax=Sphingomonas zeae TaxID=1646122 RepID=A0A7Y6B2Y7_9SPHN|nr:MULTISPECIES: hypothetical protein [Sphingomonas]MBB4049638.1 hypothetical protein [Sphingomonas zeae]MDK8217943.1 hypothetical protein [Sphingomonas sp. UMB7805-LC452B]NUU46020.1 hypothetical protein [Sphingomonas zeae]